MGDSFDVFLCHNSTDKVAVRALADLLVARGLRVWLDERELIPGRPWPEGLEAGIRASRSVAVLLGRDGQRPWQKAELQAALQLGVEQGLPVIPVLLPGAPAEPELPLFLKARTWVDLRQGFTPNGLDRLEWGIRGTRSVEPPSPEPAAPRAPRWRLALGLAAAAGLVLLGVADLMPGGGRAPDAPALQVPPPPAPRQLLRGRLVDELTHDPLPGVRIHLSELKLTMFTDSDGQFEFHLDVPANKRVKVYGDLPGYERLDEDPMVGDFLNQWPMRRKK